MIDGMHVEEHVLLVALAIDGEGKKHVHWACTKARRKTQ
jgi:hypothetical protein